MVLPSRQAVLGQFQLHHTRRTALCDTKPQLIRQALIIKSSSDIQILINRYRYMLSRLAGSFLALSIIVFAADGEPDTRAEVLAEEQQQKLKELKPQGLEKAEQVYDRVVDNPIVKRLMGNKSKFGIQFGTLFPGAGFSMGPDYSVRGLLNENLDLNFAAVGSIKQYY